MKPAISEAIPATATALMRVGATTSRLAASGGGVSDKQPNITAQARQIIVSRSSENSVTAPTGRPKGSRHANQRGTLSGSDAMNIWCRI